MKRAQLLGGFFVLPGPLQASRVVIGCVHGSDIFISKRLTQSGARCLCMCQCDLPIPIPAICPGELTLADERRGVLRPKGRQRSLVNVLGKFYVMGFAQGHSTVD